MTAPRCVRQVCESCGLPLPARHDNPVDPGICWAEYDLRAKIACRDRTIARLNSELEGMRGRVKKMRGSITRFNSKRSNPDQYMRDIIAADDALARQGGEERQ